MPRGLAAPLAEVLDLIERKIIPREVKERIQERASVARREDEPVAVHPVRVAGVVPQVLRPERHRCGGHAHRHARMPGFCLLNRIHGQAADRVYAEIVQLRETRRPRKGLDRSWSGRLVAVPACVDDDMRVVFRVLSLAWHRG